MGNETQPGKLTRLDVAALNAVEGNQATFLDDYKGGAYTVLNTSRKSAKLARKPLEALISKGYAYKDAVIGQERLFKVYSTEEGRRAMAARAQHLAHTLKPDSVRLLRECQPGKYTHVAETETLIYHSLWELDKSAERGAYRVSHLGRLCLGFCGGGSSK